MILHPRTPVVTPPRPYPPTPRCGPPAPHPRGHHFFRSGQAIVETLIVVILLVGIFLFFFDFSTAAITRILLENASARVARADTVGFNSFQCAKSFRVSMIPVSGRREIPAPDRGITGWASELAFIRAYLQSQTYAEANGTLRYERWDDLSYRIRRQNDTIRVTSRFDVPPQLPHKFAAFFGLSPDTRPDSHPVTSGWAIEDHASHYLAR